MAAIPTGLHGAWGLRAPGTCSSPDPGTESRVRFPTGTGNGETRRERGAPTVRARTCATLNRRPERKEFQEIGHCGGQFIVEVRTENGQRGVSFGVTHSRPVPASLVAIYALPQGIPVGMILLAGIGQPFNPPPYPGCFHIFIASDSQDYLATSAPAAPGTGGLTRCRLS